MAEKQFRGKTGSSPDYGLADVINYGWTRNTL